MQTTLYYNFPRQPPDNGIPDYVIDYMLGVSELTKKIMDALNQLAEQRRPVSVGLMPDMNGPYHALQFESENADDLEKALATFIDRAGTPNFVDGNKRVLNNVLSDYGSRAAKSLSTLYLGYVVKPVKNSA